MRASKTVCTRSCLLIETKQTLTKTNREGQKKRACKSECVPQIKLVPINLHSFF